MVILMEGCYIEIIISLVLLIVGIIIYTLIVRRHEIKKELEASILNQSPESINAEIKREALKGNKIKAIRLYREMTGIGLKEAKDYIDKLSNGFDYNDSAHAKMDPSIINAEIEREISMGNKIKAIKLYREMTGAGLKEAKDYIDDLSNRLNN